MHSAGTCGPAITLTLCVNTCRDVVLGIETFTSLQNRVSCGTSTHLACSSVSGPCKLQMLMCRWSLAWVGPQCSWPMLF